MGIFDFLFKKTDTVKNENTIDSTELLKGKKSASSKKEVKTALSLHPDWEVPQEQQYIFNFLANDLAPLQPNQLSLSTISMEEKDGDWFVRAFFRSSLDHAIELGEIELYILDKDGELLASKRFDFSALGVIPAESARPWVFTFEKGTQKQALDGVLEEGWRIAFNLVFLRGHQLDLDPSWEKQLTAAQKEHLENIVKGLPELKDAEINFTGLQIQQTDEGALNATVLIRNGHHKAVNLEQLPLEIYDANSNRVAHGSFKMDPPITVEPNTTKPWTFIFPASLVEKEELDLSRWSARVARQS